MRVPIIGDRDTAPVAGWELNPEGPATPTSEAAIETETVGVAMEVAGYHIISTNAQDMSPSPYRC
jgi:hypothetical protein